MIGTPPGHLSPDGLWRWDGLRWIPTQTSYGEPASAAPPRRSMLVIGGGVITIVGAVVLAAGCAIPYVHYPDDTSGQSSWPSIFNPGFSGGWGGAVEPAVVILAAIAGAILVMAWTSRIVRGVVAGAIAIMGIQTIAMFVGFIVAGAEFGQLQAGAIVGPLGALIVFVGGAALVGSLLRDRA